MIVARVSVSGAHAWAVDKKPITAGMVGAQVQLIYTDSVWKGLKKTLVFYGAVTRYIVTDAEVVTIPAAVLAKPNIQLVVGVYGENAAGSLVIPTLRAELGMIRVGTMADGNKDEYVLDTSDATATAKDMAEGVTAYVNGEKVTGTLPVLDQLGLGSAAVDKDGAYITMEAKPPFKRIIHDGTAIHLRAKSEKFGDATAEDVAAGKTFTSAAGLKVTGTHACPEGLDTTDATATAEDMAEGKTAYVNGQKVNGTLPDGTYLSTNTADSIRFEDAGSRFGPLEKYQLAYITHPFSERRIVGEDCSLSIVAPASSLGNAKASDVAKGKTFTSTAGLKVTGTHECAESLDTSDATATAEDMAEGVTAYVNGQKITGTVPEKVELVKYDAVAGEILVISSGSDGSHDTSRNGKYIEISATLDDGDGKAIVSPGTELSQRLRPAEFGDAAAEDVAAGKTFTSSAGLKVTGTHECSGGIDTSDATATAEDMAQGVTAYVNGEKVTGTIPEISELVKDDPSVEEIVVTDGPSDEYEITKELVSSGTKPSDCSTTKYASYTVTEDGFFQLSGSTTSTLQWFSYVTGQTTNAKSIYRANFSDASTKYYLWTLVEKEEGVSETYIAVSTELDETDGKGIVKPTTTIRQRVEPSVFGDAAASDVAAGKTFTSAAGLKVTGTHECTDGLDTSDATATAADILIEKTAYVNGQKVTGTIATKTSSDLSSSGATVTVPAGYYAENASKSVSTVTQATPSISVDTSGKITATSEQTAGYVASGTKSATKQLTTQAAQTITPGTADKTIASGKYLTGTQTVKGDANLVAGNIKSGVSIFGVSGSYEGSGGLDTSDATAAAEDIAEGKTAYVNGEKVTGTIGNIGSIMDYPYTQNGTAHTGADVKFLDASKNAASQNIPSRIQLSCGFTDLCSPSSGRYLFDKSAENTIGIAAEATKFGDATAEDVAAGKTFTSAAGLKVTGTHECGTAAGDNNCEAYQITSTSGTVSPKGSGTVKVWGYGYKSGSYSGTTYAFVGDGYYSGGYGTPSKTSATFGINADGTVSGLPSGLTALNVLVTIGI